MPSCFVCGRTENQKSKSANISFHRFSTKDNIREQWDKFLVKNYLNPKDVTKYSVICSLHFEKSCFFMKQYGKLLYKHIFPSIVVGRIKYAKQSFTESTKTVPAPQTIKKNDILHFDKTLIKVSSISDVEGVLPLDVPSVSSKINSYINKCNMQNKNVSNKSEAELMATSEIAMEDTPRHTCLKRSIRQLSKEIVIKNKKLKSLQQTIRRKNKRIANMQTIINDIKNQNLVDEETSVSPLESIGKHKDLVTNWTKKNLGKKIPKKYSPAVRQFPLSLHFFSEKAYEYLRDQFNTILPHPRTLNKWYIYFNAEPGFTMESLKLLELKVRNSSDPVFCALIMDEMAIRQHLEYDRSTGKYYGRVDMGSEIDNDSLAVAKECLVFLVVSINENWKLPIGYFLAHSFDSAQKVKLVRRALHILSNACVNIISLTFDGCSTNITVAKLLGCNFTVDTLNTLFASEYDDSKIVAIFDPAHRSNWSATHLVKRKYSWIMKIMKLILNMFNVYVTYSSKKDVI
ncbi:hypothetical protein QTP88_028607 [Uroleucon formosanum]